MLGKRMGCSFCGRRNSEVEKLVAGPVSVFGRVYICDRCAVQTIKIMEASSGDDQPRGEKPSLLRRTLNLLGWERQWHDSSYLSSYFEIGTRMSIVARHR
jgi:hypothetical protein